jgi:hypothetical protein
MTEKSIKQFNFSEDSVTHRDIYDRLTNKKILATTALYGPWTPDGKFDWLSYENLVREVMQSGSVPATNVDTTWAIYNDGELTKQMIWRTAEIANENEQYIEKNRPLIVAGLNTNSLDISYNEISNEIEKQVIKINAGLKERNFSRIRYMIVPDKRIYHAPPQTKINVYKEIGKVIAEYTDFGFVFFELDIGIPGFGSNFSANEIAEILFQTPQIQEYKSAIISKKLEKNYPYDFRADLTRIKIVEDVAPNRVQFSTGNDWFVFLARLGKNIKNYGYLLGASQISPKLFQQWREGVEHNKPEALAIEQDLQAAAKDFWTPGNVGIYRHYVGIFLAMTGLISHPLPHPLCEERYHVKAADYFIPLKHAIRLGLVEKNDISSLVMNFIPGYADCTVSEIQEKVEFLN